MLYDANHIATELGGVPRRRCDTHLVNFVWTGGTGQTGRDRTERAAGRDGRDGRDGTDGMEGTCADGREGMEETLQRNKSQSNQALYPIYSLEHIIIHTARTHRYTLEPTVLPDTHNENASL